MWDLPRVLHLQMTIREFASIAEKGLVSTLYRRTMDKLLKVPKEAGKTQNTKGSNSMEIDNTSDETSLSVKRAKLYDLSITLLPRLDTKEIDFLFDAAGLGLNIQKKAYKVLSTIIEQDSSFIARRFQELVELVRSSHSSATQHRLDCLYFLIAHVLKDKSEQMEFEIVSSFLTEIVLGLKESNKKTRNRAHEIIVRIGHSSVEDGNNQKLYNFFNMVAGGLAGETPHMISASMKGVACLTYEFNDLRSYAFNVLPSTFLLLQRNNRELNKASLGFLKVLVAKSQAEGLQAHLRGMVEALLSWESSSKTAKVKQLLEMLVKKCGFDAVKEVVPEEHMKLLTNIRKIIERKERKHSKSWLSKATTSRLSRCNHTKVFSDFGDEETDNGSSKKPTFKSRKRLAEDSYEDLPLDLLDREKTRSSLRSFNSLKTKLQLDVDEPEIDAQGRLIISEDSPGFKTAEGSDSVMRSQKRRKTSQSGYAYAGSKYSNKKAGGDLKRMGKLEPYAYWPLDRKMVSRRPDNRAAARMGMLSAVKSVKELKTKRSSSKH